MMLKHLLSCCLLSLCVTVHVTAHAQGCEGGLYLNPQVIRGEGASQTDSALRELVEFIRPTGLSVTPVLNIKDVQDVRAGVGRTVPPCWIYGNPVIGLASGYRAVSVNLDTIQSAVLILGDMGTVKDGKPRQLKELPADEQARVLAKLKTASCFGMKSGVTTAHVQAQNLCGTVVEVPPQQGLGQSYLPTKAAFQWQPDRWVGLITRLQAAQASTLKGHYGTDERLHMAQLVVVPATQPSWGYGIYTHPAAPPDAVKKATLLFSGLKGGSPLLLKALDLGSNFEFAAPSETELQAMRTSLGAETRLR
jgi:hypothetical protein